MPQRILQLAALCLCIKFAFSACQNYGGLTCYAGQCDTPPRLCMHTTITGQTVSSCKALCDEELACGAFDFYYAEGADGTVSGSCCQWNHDATQYLVPRLTSDNCDTYIYDGGCRNPPGYTCHAHECTFGGEYKSFAGFYDFNDCHALCDADANCGAFRFDFAETTGTEVQDGLCGQFSFDTVDASWINALSPNMEMCFTYTRNSQPNAPCDIDVCCRTGGNGFTAYYMNGRYTYVGASSGRAAYKNVFNWYLYWESSQAGWMINDNIAISSGYAYNSEDVETPDLISQSWLVDDSTHQANFWDPVDDIDLEVTTTCYVPPTQQPTDPPTDLPTQAPTQIGQTHSPTDPPTQAPTAWPTESPTDAPVPCYLIEIIGGDNTFMNGDCTRSSQYNGRYSYFCSSVGQPRNSDVYISWNTNDMAWHIGSTRVVSTYFAINYDDIHGIEFATSTWRVSSVAKNSWSAADDDETFNVGCKVTDMPTEHPTDPPTDPPTNSPTAAPGSLTESPTETPTACSHIVITSPNWPQYAGNCDQSGTTNGKKYAFCTAFREPTREDDIYIFWYSNDNSWRIASRTFDTTALAINYDNTDFMEQITSPWMVADTQQDVGLFSGADEDPTFIVDCFRTDAPTDAPTSMPTDSPTDAPTDTPTDAPTNMPTESPTNAPTQSPSESPTDMPTDSPTNMPTETPSQPPTESPTSDPYEPTEILEYPTESPTADPLAPSESPTDAPTSDPYAPTADPHAPTELLTGTPTSAPTDAPTSDPYAPTEVLTNAPTESPTATYEEEQEEEEEELQNEEVEEEEKEEAEEDEEEEEEEEAGDNRHECFTVDPDCSDLSDILDGNDNDLESYQSVLDCVSTNNSGTYAEAFDVCEQESNLSREDVNAIENCFNECFGLDVDSEETKVSSAVSLRSRLYEGFFYSVVHMFYFLITR